MVSAEIHPTDSQKYDRDLNAAENILRRGISELWCGGKTVSDTVLPPLAHKNPTCFSRGSMSRFIKSQYSLNLNIH